MRRSGLRAGDWGFLRGDGLPAACAPDEDIGEADAADDVAVGRDLSVESADDSGRALDPHRDGSQSELRRGALRQAASMSSRLTILPCQLVSAKSRARRQASAAPSRIVRQHLYWVGVEPKGR